MSTVRFLLYILSLSSIIGMSSCLFKAPSFESTADPVSHQIWDELLAKHVDDNGMVDYQAFAKDSARLNEYLSLLSNNAPDEDQWTQEEQMAYWINAYNAFTVDLILDHYPVESIKDIKNGIPFVSTVWDIKFFKIAGEDFDLNAIEHGILRKQDDPRFHFALVCASLSCPKLQPFAYTASELETQLEEAAREFINEPFRNQIDQRPLKISKLLDWYWGDFKNKYKNPVELVNAYTDEQVPAGTAVEYLEYDWSINDQAKVDSKIFE